MSVTTKIIGLASTAVIFAGMAFGQQALTCNSSFTVGGGGNTTSPSVPIELRSEGATELVADVLANCAAAPAGSTTGFVTATLSATGLQAITSAVLNKAGVTEATLTVSGGGVTYYQGTIAGTTITFPNVTFPSVPFMLEVSNVRVNVTGQYPNNLQPVTETLQLTAQGNGLAAVTNIPAITVGNQRNSLSVTGSSATPYIAPGTSSVAGTASGIVNNTPNNYLVCNAGGAIGFSLSISELFPGAFKTQAQETLGSTNAAAFSVAGIPGSESGSLLGVGLAGTGVANSGTRIKVVFGGIPTNATVIVPTTVTGTGGLGFIMSLTSGSETGAFAQATTPSGTTAGYAPISNNTAIYEVKEADYTATGTFVLQPIVTFAANSLTVPTGPITVAVSYAPSPATNGASLASPIPTIPYFANTSTTLSASTFSACQTTLLFPFVTNQQGFDTGIVVANTGMDYLNPTGKTTSVASGQSGACTFQFYGSNGVEGATNPGLTPITAANFPSATNTPTTSIAVGSTHAGLLSSMAPNFQGYAIAVCPFLYARGFAFIEDGLTTNSGVVEGYLADVISSDRKAPSAFGVTVANNSPEYSGQ